LAWVYILQSAEVGKFYIGATTETAELRLERHKNGYYQNKFTSQASDWEMFLSFQCDSNRQAFAIEQHIKKMKSATYIHNLKKYPEMIEKLKLKYSNS